MLQIILIALLNLSPQPAPLQPANHGGHYVDFLSRESQSPPRLVLTADDGSTREVDPRADSTIGSIQPDTPLFRMRELRVNLGDTYRTLLRFDNELGDDVKHAELILQFGKSDLPPVEPYEIAMYELVEAWPEMSVTWQRQPAARETPFKTLKLQPQDRELRIDVTESVKRWIADPDSNNGWMFKTATVFPVMVNPEMKSADFEKQILQLHAWAGSVDAACDQARRENKLVFAVVRAGHTEAETVFLEQMLLSIVLADPDVRLLLKHRFVPVRVRVDPATVMGNGGGIIDAVRNDPLRELGTTLKRTRPLAIVVLSPDKKFIDQLSNIGTFDPPMVHQFLLSSLVSNPTSQPATQPPAAGDPWQTLECGDVPAARAAFEARGKDDDQLGLARIALLTGDNARAVEIADKLVADDGRFADDARALRGVALTRLGRFDDAARALADVGDSADEYHRSAAAYYLACLHQRRGDAKTATGVWQRLAANRLYTAPFAAKAQARLFYPDAMAMYENLVAVPRPSGHSLEIKLLDDAIDGIRLKAVQFLLSQQRPDGTWPNSLFSIYDPAITALTGKALLRVRARVDQEHAARIETAVKKATAALDEFVKSADPKTAECFSTAYVLDFQLDLFERDAERRDAAQRAVALVIGGQCPNGAWSYNPEFDRTWRGGFGGWPVTDKGRTHSMNTAPSMLALLRAQKLGLNVPQDVLARGKEVLLKMRQAPARFTYTYPDPICFAEASQSIGRAPACEQVLLQLGAGERGDLSLSIDNFLRYRSELRKPTKLTQAWISPVGSSGYFYFFAYYHAALVIADLHGEKCDEHLAALRSDVLSVAEADGTWIDDPQIGKVYGTSMALLVLDITRP